MKTCNRTSHAQGLASAIALLLVGNLASQAVQATVLQFDQTRNAASGVAVEPVYAGADLPQDYGDRVGSSPQSVSGGQYTYGNAGEGYTPNVEVTYLLGVGPAVQMWTTGYGSLANVIYGSHGSQWIDIQLTADPGYSVLLHGFDLAGWANTDYLISGVSVFEASNTLFAQTNVTVGGAFTQPFTHFEFSTPLSGSNLTLRVNYANLAANIQDNIGLDNLRFSQFPSPVPEPSNWVYLLAGTGLVAWAVRRRNESGKLRQPDSAC
jgi:hypothetical protein